MAKYNYILSDFPNNKYDSDSLTIDISVSSISSANLDYMDGYPEGVDIYFDASLSVPDVSTLDTVVANHQGIADPGPVEVTDLTVDGSLSGYDGNFETLRVNGKLYADWLKNMHSASRASVVRIDDTDPLANDNIGGMVILNPGGGNPYGSGETQYWIGVDSSGVTRAGFAGDFKALLNSATNVGSGEGLAIVANETELGIKSLKEGTNITLTTDASSVTITAAGGGGGVYGTEYQLQTSLAETSSTSNTPVTKTTLTTTSLPSGTYKITVAWIGRGNSANQDILFDVTLNGTAQGTTDTMNIEPKDGTNYVPFSRIFYLSLSGVNDIALRYWSEATNSVGVSDATIELIRVS